MADGINWDALNRLVGIGVMTSAIIRGASAGTPTASARRGGLAPAIVAAVAAGLQGMEYAPYIRPLGNLVILFAQAEAEWLKLVAEVSGCTEKDARQLLKQMNEAPVRQKIINDLAQTTGIEGFDLRELSESIEKYYCDRERRNQLMHGEWYVSLLLAPGVPRTRRLSPKKDAAVIWGDSTPDDVWQLARRFLDYKRLFSYHTHHLQRKGSCASDSDVSSDD
jgi:hypothetical protein